MGGREVENSKKFGEIGEMGWSTTMGVGKWRIRRNMEKSEKWAGRPLWGSGNGEFEEILRNRDNRMTGSEHGPMFIKTLPFTNLKQHTKTPRYNNNTHIHCVAIQNYSAPINRNHYVCTRNHCVAQSPLKNYWKTTLRTPCIPGPPPLLPLTTQTTTV